MEAQERLWRTGQVTACDSLAAAAAEFERHCRRHTASTQYLYQLVIRAFVARLPAHAARIQQLTGQDLEEYLSQLRDAGRLNRTINVHLTVLKSFCRWLAGQYGIPNPADRVRFCTEDPPDHRFLSPAEYAQLVAACCPAVHPPGSPLWYDRILFLANTGLRASEFSAAVRTGRLRPDLTALTIVGKGRRQRVVPLNRTCQAILGRPYLYQPIGRQRLYLDIRRLSRRAGIRPCGPHSLRHLFATNMLLAGVPIAKVARILGHSIRICESTYAHILPQDLAHATEVLDSPDSPL
jgi:integrase/recombinase XerC